MYTRQLLPTKQLECQYLEMGHRPAFYKSAKTPMQLLNKAVIVAMRSNQKNWLGNEQGTHLISTYE